MKKTTLKNVIALFVCLMVLQISAQTFQANTPYRLRTAIPAQESYNASATPYPDQLIYPTAASTTNAVALKPKEASGETNQLFEFQPVTGVTFEYPAGSGSVYQVYNVVSVITPVSGNGTGVLERNDLTSNGQRMRLKGNAPSNNNLNNVIVVSNPVSDANFNVTNAVAIIFTYGTDANTTDLRRFVATTNYDWLNFGGIAPAGSSSAWIDSWVLENAAGNVVTLSNEKFDTSEIFISNPVKNQLNIKGLNSNVKQISVYSLLGKEVLSRKVETQTSLSVDVSGLSKGMYLVKIAGERGSISKKIIKE